MDVSGLLQRDGCKTVLREFPAFAKAQTAEKLLCPIKRKGDRVRAVSVG